MRKMNNENKDLKISLIIVAYEETTLLDITLDSITKSIRDVRNGFSFEIILVDNSDSNLVNEYILNSRFLKTVIYHKNRENGFGRANNIGAFKSSGEFLIFINPDIKVSENFFSELITLIDINENSFYSPKQLMFDGKKLMNYYFIDKFSIYSDLKIKIFNHIDYFNPVKMYLSGAFLIIRKSDFFNAGMFDEDFFMYYEEPDITKRLMINGVFAKYLSEISYEHYGGGSSSSLGIDTDKIRLTTFEIYAKKWSINYNKSLRLMYLSAFIKQCIYSLPLKKNSYKANYQKQLMALIRSKIAT
jgi:GT2 family glycosyltransferase